MPERRQLGRTHVLKGALIVLDHSAPPVVCTAHNLTNLGACLQVAPSVEIPDLFYLSFDSFRSTRRCRVIWRTENRLGISFI
jgi:hypothetical protein